MNIIKPFLILSFLYILHALSLSANTADVSTEFAYIVESEYIEGEDFAYVRTSNQRNFFNFFNNIDLDKDGIPNAEASMSGCISFVVKYKRKMFIVNMYRDEGVFHVSRDIKIRNGKYYTNSEDLSEDLSYIYLPKLYNQLKYLFYKYPRFNRANKLYEKGYYKYKGKK